MIRILFYALVLIALYQFAKRFLAGQAPAVIVSPQGISVKGGRLEQTIGWDEIRQIDVVRMPTSGGTRCSVVLFGNNVLTVYDRYKGFDLFGAWIMERWPEIRSEWQRVLSGPADISERVTVWPRSAV